MNTICNCQLDEKQKENRIFPSPFNVSQWTAGWDLLLHRAPEKRLWNKPAQDGMDQSTPDSLGGGVAPGNNVQCFMVSGRCGIKEH